ncbi:hypothetical protein FRB94_010659 [Tulasnella sp. JGI-2019a]|nr:hypothetical protein FRB94_010659 [Tulasnella sp. JGI-2019a]KAG9011318.1 hypothetical protein FRB93_003120 [Tulasnella sp. JGI-2019a]
MCTPPPANGGTDTLIITHHPTATSAHQSTASILQAHEINTHIILSHVLSQRSQELAASTSQPQPALPPSLWLAVWTTRSQHRTLDIIVALTTGPLGPRPLFIASPHISATLTWAFLRPRIDLLVSEILGLDNVPMERIFSVFGPKPLVQAFATVWSRGAGVLPIDDPYTSATYRICCPSRLVAAPPQAAGGEARLATIQDLERVSELLRQFAEPGPYILTPQTAHQEALAFISANCLYVYESRTHAGAPVITSIAVIERTSTNVACVTKLYTADEYRANGFGTRLLRYVCQFLLHRQRKAAVMMYVPDGSGAPDKVTRRVGFRDVDRQNADRDWLEQGFQETNLGHW